MFMTRSTLSNGAILTAHEATIQTAQVDIRVLKVGKKQVTMGLFRQLLLRQLVSPRAQLLGEPWGHVAYWWEGDGRHTNAWGGYVRGPQLHIVWQRDGGLYRDIIYEALSEHYVSGYQQRIEVAAYTYWAAAHPGFVRVHQGHRERGPWHDEDEVHACHRILLQNDGVTPEIDRLFAIWGQRIGEYHAYTAAWTQLWSRLQALPQLFIAV